MRKKISYDFPFEIVFILSTYILERAEQDKLFGYMNADLYHKNSLEVVSQNSINYADNI